MIIGLVGKKQSGKDTVGDHLCAKHGFVRYSFAEPLKKVAEIIFGYPITENNKETVDEVLGVTPRQFLQWFGTDVMQFVKLPGWKLSRQIWVNFFMRWLRENQYENVVITDVRFLHEAEFLNCLSDTALVRVIRGKDSVDPHPSEVELDSIKCDVIIQNSGTKEELYDIADSIVRFIEHRFER